MNDQNKKTLRQFQCRDYLWEIFEQMSGELECSVDYLINEAMRQYARSRNYGARTSPPDPGGARPLHDLPAQAAPTPRVASSQQPGYSQPAYPQPGYPQPGYPQAPSYPQQPPSAPTPSHSAPNYSAPNYSAVAHAPTLPENYPGQHPYPAPPGPTRPSRAPYPAPPPSGYPAPPVHPAAGLSSYPPGETTRPPGLPAPPAPPQTAGFSAAPPPLPGGSAPHANPASLPSLFVIFNGQKFPVNKEEFIIGRGTKTADLAIKDGNISRRHAAIIHQNGAFYMKDLGSTNGIEFQGRRVDGRRIEEGDVYQLCDYELRFTYR